MTIFTRRRFCEIWNLLQEYDEDLRARGFFRRDTKSAVWVWILIIIAIIFVCVINQTGMFAFDESFFYNFTYLLIYFGTFTSICKFSVMVLVIGFRFQHLDKIAKLEMVRGNVSSKVSRLAHACCIEVLLD